MDASPVILYVRPRQGTAGKEICIIILSNTNNLLQFHLDQASYVSFGGIYSSSHPSSNCFTSYTFPRATSENQPKTFYLALTSPFPEQDVILDPPAVVVKITNKGISTCC